MSEIPMNAGEYRDHEADLRDYDVEQAVDHATGLAEIRAAEARLGLTDERRAQIAREVRAKHAKQWEDECVRRVLASVNGVEGKLDDGGHIDLSDPNERYNLKCDVEREAEAFPGNTEEFRDRVYGAVVSEIEYALEGVA